MLELIIGIAALCAPVIMLGIGTWGIIKDNQKPK